MNSTTSPPWESEDEQVRAVFDDFVWAFERARAGQMAEFQGQHVAVVNKQVLASGVNSITLLDSVCAEHHLDPQRVVIMYIDP